MTFAILLRDISCASNSLSCEMDTQRSETPKVVLLRIREWMEGFGCPSGEDWLVMCI